MRTLAAFSLRNRALIALVTVFVALFGGFSMSSLKQELFPNLQLPVLAVVTPYAGASPEGVEQQVSEPVEEALRALDNIDSMTSTSSPGASTVLVMFDYGTDMDRTKMKAEAAISGLRTLPQDVEPIVFTGDVSQMPVVQMSVTADLSAGDLADRVTRLAVPEFEDIEGVQRVDVVGAPTNRVEITLDPAKATRAGVDAAAIADGLEANGRLMPVGQVDSGDQSLAVQVGRTPTSLEELGQVAVPAGKGAVRLADVAELTKVEAAPTTHSRTDGRDSLSLAITKVPDGNTVEISRQVHELFDDLETSIGADAEFTVSFDQAPQIKDSVKDLAVEGALGLVMAVLVILVFLRSARSTLVTALSIPLSLLVALIGLKVGGYTLNMFTLGAITVAVGRVVDDAIVVIENIKRHLSYGEEKKHAIITAVREVGGAISSSTLATAAVFIPIGLVSGMAGEFLRPFAFTVALAMMASLLVALTIVPVLAYWFMPEPRITADVTEVEAAAEAAEARTLLRRIYDPALRFTVRRPWSVVALAVVVLLGTVALSQLLRFSMLGDSGATAVNVVQKLAPATSLQAADASAREVEKDLLGIEGVEHVQTSVGQGSLESAFSGGGTTYSVMFAEDADAAAVQERVEKAVKAFDGEFTMADPMGGSSNTIAVSVTAPTDEVRAEAAAILAEEFKKIDKAGEVTTDAAPEQPVLAVNANATGLAAGVTDSALGGLLGATLNDPPLGTVTLDDQRLDVVMSKPTRVTTKAQLEKLPMGGATLPQVADVQTEQVPTGITRVDGQRTITVEITPKAEDLGTVTAAVNRALGATDLPEGAEASTGGAAEEMAKSFAQLGLALLVAIAIVYTIMVGTFRSLVQPLILLVSIPFAATGAILLLVLTGITLDVVGMIGALMLIGIVVTNAIVLIDLVNQARESGRGLVDSVLYGGDKRVRPIVMTALATILALTPMALGLTGGSGFISQPLAVVVIGGLVTSTLLTLLLVPALYLLVERGKERRAARRAARRAGRLAAGRSTRDDEPDPEPAVV